MELRRQLGPHPVAVMNVVNGHIGYLPPRHLFREDLYAVWQTPFEAGALELLTESAIQTAQRLLKAE